MREVKKDGIVLARHILQEDIQDGLNFFSQDEELRKGKNYWHIYIMKCQEQ